MKKRYKRKRSGWMRRTSRIYLNKINKGKKEKLKEFLNLFKNWPHFIETETNRYLKELDLDNVNVISLENLKNVKRKTRGKFSRKVNRLLSFWLYAKVGKRLRQICEERGIRINVYKTRNYDSRGMV